MFGSWQQLSSLWNDCCGGQSIANTSVLTVNVHRMWMWMFSTGPPIKIRLQLDSVGTLGSALGGTQSNFLPKYSSSHSYTRWVWFGWSYCNKIKKYFLVYLGAGLITHNVHWKWFVVENCWDEWGKPERFNLLLPPTHARVRTCTRTQTQVSFQSGSLSCCSTAAQQLYRLLNWKPELIINLSVLTDGNCTSSPVDKVFRRLNCWSSTPLSTFWRDWHLFPFLHSIKPLEEI